MDECDGTLGATAGHGVDELEPVQLEADERLSQVRDLEAHVVETLPFRCEESRDAGRIVGRLDEFDLRFTDAEEGDADPIGRDVHDRLELEAEHIAP